MRRIEAFKCHAVFVIAGGPTIGLASEVALDPGEQRLPDRHDTAANRRAESVRLYARLTLSNVVTTPRSDVMFVVTEYGIVNLKGGSVAVSF